MQRPSIFSNQWVRLTVIIIVICIISIPFFIYSVPYEIRLYEPHFQGWGRAGGTVEFQVRFEMIGGNRDRIVEINIHDSDGEWEIVPNENPFTINPDSTKVISLICHIPIDAHDGEGYFIMYDLDGDYDSSNEELIVNVENSREHDTVISSNDWSEYESGGDYALSSLVFIPEVIIVVGIIVLQILIRKEKNKVVEKEQS
jgi:hypothetical protein